MKKIVIVLGLLLLAAQAGNIVWGPYSIANCTLVIENDQATCYDDAPTPDPVPMPSPEPYTVAAASETAPYARSAVRDSGDGNGFEINGNFALADGGGAAADMDSGTGALTSCASPTKDREIFFFPAPNLGTVTGVQIRLDGWADGTFGVPKLCVGISWDGGTTYGPYQTARLGTTEQSYWLGGMDDMWGHTRAIASNLMRVRVVPVAGTVNRDFFLDYITAKIFYRQEVTEVPSGGPLLDSYLVAATQNLTREYGKPERVGMVVPSMLRDPNSDLMNFSVVVLRESSRFRMWYSSYNISTSQRGTGYSESADGQVWNYPGQNIPSLITLNSAVNTIWDDGRGADRYKALIPDRSSLPPRWYANLFTSADGLIWNEAPENPITPMQYGETWELFRLAGNEYGVLHRWNQPYTWTDAEGVSHENTIHDPSFTRLYAYTAGNLTNLPPSRVIFAPGEQDSGETQFYSVSNVVQRGPYYITMLMVLRDDLVAPGIPNAIDWNGGLRPTFGVGYTVLAWSADGLTWHRETDPFFSPDPDPDAFDHAHAWIDSIVPVGNELYLYYGGYQYGHKVFGDRAIGLATLPQDRYIGWSGDNGRLWTRPLANPELFLNVSIEPGGVVWPQILDENGTSVLSFADCQPITTGGTEVPIVCSGNLPTDPIVVELFINRATVYGVQ